MKIVKCRSQHLKKNQINVFKICHSKDVLVSWYISQRISRKSDSFKCCWLAMLAFSPLSCCSLWSSPHHLPDTQHDTSPNKVSSPTWFVSHLVQCENIHLRFAFQSNKIDPVTLVKTNLYRLSAAYRIACNPQLMSEPLWHLAPHSCHSPRHRPPDPCSHLQWLTPLSTPPMAFTSHFLFSRSSQSEAILFCWDYFAMIGHIFYYQEWGLWYYWQLLGSKLGAAKHFIMPRTAPKTRNYPTQAYLLLKY